MATYQAVKVEKVVLKSPPLFFSDLDKVAKDIQKDDYNLKRSLKIKHVTPQGVSVTSDNEHTKGGIASKLTFKYAHRPSGFALDKLEVKPDGKLYAETSIVGLSPGLKLIARADDKLKGDLAAEYVRPQVAARAEVDSDATKLKASATFAYEGAQFGGALAYHFPGEKAGQLSDYNVGVSYGRPQWLAALTTTNKLATYNASVVYQPVVDLKSSLVADVTPEKSLQNLSLGLLYNLNRDTNLRAKVDSAGKLTAAAAQRVADKVNVALTSQVDVSKDMKPDFGFTVTLG